MDIKEFITDTLKKTISASRPRFVIFCIILCLQFWSDIIVDVVAFLQGHSYPATYDGLTQKITDEWGIRTFLGLTKYVLLFILIFKSPAESSGRRRFGKYVILFGCLYVWALMDLFSYDSHESELITLSFKEHSIPIYGKVVFASYSRQGDFSEVYAYADTLSAQTNGYIVIVQLNPYVDLYPGLKTDNHDFNYYTHHSYHTTYPTNIPQQVPDLPNCRQFVVHFPSSSKKIPAFPAVGKYVRIMYDPVKNGIEMYTDSATATTPTFDSIP